MTTRYKVLPHKKGVQNYARHGHKYVLAYKYLPYKNAGYGNITFWIKLPMMNLFEFVCVLRI